MTLRHAALSSLFIVVTAACSSSMSEDGGGRGGAGGTNSSGGSGGSGTGGSTGGSGGSTTGGSGGSNTGGSGTGGSTGGSGGTGTGGTGGTTGTGGSTTGGAAGSGGAGTGGTGTGGAGTGGTGTGGAAGTGGGAGTGGTGGAVDAGGKGGTAGSSGSAGKDGGSGGGMVDAPPPPPTDGGPPDIPPPMGPCPDFIQGDVDFTTKTGARKVAVSMTSAATGSGPLIFYWHETGGNPTRAAAGLPIPTITAAGGIVAAPYDSYPTDAFPWIGHYTDHDALFDEVFACAVQKNKINPGRVHATGFSAGAMMTTHLSYARSKYLASISAYSGGGSGTFQDMNNKFAALIITGGTGDVFGGTTNFYTMSKTWQTSLKGAGHFAAFCDHGGGHSLPNATIRGAVYQFFIDHPYGTNPSPYAGGKIPSALSAICTE